MITLISNTMHSSNRLLRPRTNVASFNLILAIWLCGLVAAVAIPNTLAQGTPTRRDHLTEQEAGLVREAQRIDQRTAIFIKAVDRRLLALGALTGNTAPTADAKSIAKDEEKYGAIPNSTAAELLSDIERILDEAITNIDDASEKKRQPEFMSKTLGKLSEAATRHLARLTPLRSSLKDESVRLALERAIENAESIVDAAKASGNQ